MSLTLQESLALIADNVDKVAAAGGATVGALKVQVVEELPSIYEAEDNTIYMVKSKTYVEENNIYEKYIATSKAEYGNPIMHFTYKSGEVPPNFNFNNKIIITQLAVESYSPSVGGYVEFGDGEITFQLSRCSFNTSSSVYNFLSACKSDPDMFDLELAIDEEAKVVSIFPASIPPGKVVMLEKLETSSAPSPLSGMGVYDETTKALTISSGFNITEDYGIAKITIDSNKMNLTTGPNSFELNPQSGINILSQNNGKFEVVAGSISLMAANGPIQIGTNSIVEITNGSLKVGTIRTNKIAAEGNNTLSIGDTTTSCLTLTPNTANTVLTGTAAINLISGLGTEFSLHPATSIDNLETAYANFSIQGQPLRVTGIATPNDTDDTQAVNMEYLKHVVGVLSERITALENA